MGEFVAPIIEVYPPGACPPGGPGTLAIFPNVFRSDLHQNAVSQSWPGWKTNELLTGLFFTLSPSLLPSSLPSLFREQRRNESRLMSYEPTFTKLVGDLFHLNVVHLRFAVDSPVTCALSPAPPRPFRGGSPPTLTPSGNLANISTPVVQAEASALAPDFPGRGCTSLKTFASSI